MNEFTKIHLHAVNRCGLQFEVHGTWKDQKFSIDLFTECDGRDVDSDPLGKGGYDPAPHDPDFFDAVCQDARFIEQSNAGYKVWELLQTVPE